MVNGTIIHKGGGDMFGENEFMLDGFYKRMTELREKKGVSAREMSLALGQSKGYINNIENGRNYPKMGVFFYICDYLGVTPKEFFDTESKNPTKTAAIAEKLKTLSDDQLHLIEAMIDSMQK